MAGVKGRSGGKREGAGRKRKPTTVLAPANAPAKRKRAASSNAAAPDVLPEVAAAGSAVTEGGAFDPRPTLELVAKGLLEVSVSQQKALTALLPYVHTKRGEGGKKEQKQEAAAKVAGRFAAAQPPKLAAVGGKKV
jgi:phage terminase small subunit